MSARAGHGEDVLMAPMSGQAAKPNPYAAPAPPTPNAYSTTSYHGASVPTGKVMEEEGPYTSRKCLVSGERVIAGPFKTASDCGCGLPRASVFVTNQRLVINSHLTWFYCMKHEMHESIFFKSIYSVSIGKSKNMVPGIIAIIAIVLGALMILIGFASGADWLGWLGVLLLVGGAGSMLSFVVSELMVTGANLIVEYALSKTSPGLSNAILPASPVQYITCRLPSADCLEVIRAVLSHPETSLMAPPHSV